MAWAGFAPLLPPTPTIGFAPSLPRTPTIVFAPSFPQDANNRFCSITPSNATVSLLQHLWFHRDYHVPLLPISTPSRMLTGARAQSTRSLVPAPKALTHWYPRPNHSRTVASDTCSFRLMAVPTTGRAGMPF
eukprot:309410-Chlamydomonas_euryale.AAC.13